MTAEGLHSKAAIAEQLAWRDSRIAQLEAALAIADPCDTLSWMQPEELGDFDK